MSATDFLCAQIVGTLAALLVARRLWRGRGIAITRLLLFVAAASYSFDYVANDRLIWTFRGDWAVVLILNPVENSLFAITMALDLLLIHLALEYRNATRVHKLRMPGLP